LTLYRLYILCGPNILLLDHKVNRFRVKVYKINTQHTVNTVIATKLVYVISEKFKVFVSYWMWNSTLYGKTKFYIFWGPPEDGVRTWKFWPGLYRKCIKSRKWKIWLC